jgi:hypothetical protein
LVLHKLGLRYGVVDRFAKTDESYATRGCALV